MSYSNELFELQNQQIENLTKRYQEETQKVNEWKTKFKTQLEQFKQNFQLLKKLQNENQQLRKNSFESQKQNDSILIEKRKLENKILTLEFDKRKQQKDFSHFTKIITAYQSEFISQISHQTITSVIDKSINNIVQNFEIQNQSKNNSNSNITQINSKKDLEMFNLENITEEKDEFQINIDESSQKNIQSQSELLKRIETLTISNEILREDLKNLQQKISKHKNIQSKLSEQIKDHEKEKYNLRKEVEETKLINKQIVEETQTEKKSLEEKYLQIIETSKKSMENIVNENQIQKQQDQNEIKKLKEELFNAKTTILSLQENLSKEQTEKEELVKQRDQEVQRSEELNGIVNQQNDKIQNLENDILLIYRRNKKEIKKLQKDFENNGYQKKYANVVSENQRLISIIEQLANLVLEMEQVSSLQNENSSKIQEKFSNLKFEYKKFQDKIASLIEEKDNSQQQVLSLEISYQKLQGELDQTSAELVKKCDEYKKLEEKHLEINEQIKNAKIQSERYKLEKNSLEKQLGLSRAQIVALESRVSDFQCLVEERKVENQKMEQKISGIHSDYENQIQQFHIENEKRLNQHQQDYEIRVKNIQKLSEEKIQKIHRDYEQTISLLQNQLSFQENTNQSPFQLFSMEKQTRKMIVHNFVNDITTKCLIKQAEMNGQQCSKTEDQKTISYLKNQVEYFNQKYQEILEFSTQEEQIKDEYIQEIEKELEDSKNSQKEKLSTVNFVIQVKEFLQKTKQELIDLKLFVKNSQNSQKYFDLENFDQILKQFIELNDSKEVKKESSFEVKELEKKIERTKQKSKLKIERLNGDIEKLSNEVDYLNKFLIYSRNIINKNSNYWGKSEQMNKLLQDLSEAIQDDEDEDEDEDEIEDENEIENIFNSNINQNEFNLPLDYLDSQTKWNQSIPQNSFK